MDTSKVHGFIVEPFDLGGQVKLFGIYHVDCRDAAVQCEYVAGEACEDKEAQTDALKEVGRVAQPPGSVRGGPRGTAA